jgi:hypothetical protein
LALAEFLYQKYNNGTAGPLTGHKGAFKANLLKNIRPPAALHTQDLLHVFENFQYSLGVH